MKSKASIKSHPIHPILVMFPITLFVGTFVTDVVWMFTDRVFFGQMAKYLGIGAILFAVLAAIPGIIDYRYTVPPKSSAKRRATKHALLNTGVLILFALALLLRKNDRIDVPLILLPEAVGVVLLGIAGWLGGTLVYRNQIGVDHRYAGAGKWKEETIDDEGRIELDCVNGLGINQMKLLHVRGKRIVVARTEDGLVAFDDSCSHRGGSLADGAMMCGTVQCPWHGSQFNVCTGEVKAGPAKEPIKTYPIEFIDRKYYLELFPEAIGSRSRTA